MNVGRRAALAIPPAFFFQSFCAEACTIEPLGTSFEWFESFPRTAEARRMATALMRSFSEQVADLDQLVLPGAQIQLDEHSEGLASRLDLFRRLGGYARGVTFFAAGSTLVAVVRDFSFGLDGCSGPKLLLFQFDRSNRGNRPGISRLQIVDV